MRIVVINDMHVGHEVGLNPLDSIPKKRETPFNEWVYNRWAEFCEEFHNPDYLLLNGDITDGHGGIRKGVEQFSTSFNVQVDWSVELLQMLIGDKTKTYSISGSGYHEGDRDSHNAAQSLAERLNGEYMGNIFEFEPPDSDELVQIAHGSYAGKMNPYTGLQQEMRLATENALKRHSKCPTILLRAHQHEYIRIERSTIRAIVAPCWQYLTPYMSKKTANKLPDIGGLIMELNENTKIYPKIYPIPEKINQEMRGFIKLKKRTNREIAKKRTEELKSINRNL